MGRAALEEANRALGLALAEDEIDYLVKAFLTLGAYRDEDEFFRMHGKLHEVLAYGTSLEPKEIEVQGLYEGTGKNAAGEFRIESRVVAQGKGAYKVFVRQFLGADAIATTAKDAVRLEGAALGLPVVVLGIAAELADEVRLRERLLAVARRAA